MYQIFLFQSDDVYVKYMCMYVYTYIKNVSPSFSMLLLAY